MDRFAPEHENRRRSAEMLFEFELMCLEEDYVVDEGSANLYYDEKADVFRFSDGTFALSRRYANWRELEKRGWKNW